MSQRVIAFTGISGVGKTTFLRKLAELTVFQHVTAGSLITAARNIPSDDRDAMRHVDLDENQRLLIKGFSLARDPDTELIIINGHVVIDSGGSLTKISPDVFKELDVMTMVHLEADPSRIAKNRANDTSRPRPRIAPETLGRHQDKSRTHARFIAESLRIDLHIVTHDDVAHLAAQLEIECHPTEK